MATKKGGAGKSSSNKVALTHKFPGQPAQSVGVPARRTNQPMVTNTAPPPPPKRTTNKK